MKPWRLSENWIYCKGFKVRPDYISNEVKDLREISRTQRNSARNAIIWLITKVPQTVEEIAEHFGMSASLVNSLLQELTHEQLIVRTKTSRYKLKSR